MTHTTAFASATFYRLDTGDIVGHYSGPSAWIRMNRPAGCGHVAGIHHAADAVIDPATRSVLQRPRQPAADELARQAKHARDALLAASDWVSLRASDMGRPVPEAWQAYRQALRDITAQPGWPVAINWPERPQE